jgi:hypothetical protein
MAKLTNLTSTRIIFRSVNDVDYDILPGQVLTVPDAEVRYELVDSAVENEWLDVETDSGDPFFDSYGNVSNTGAGTGMPVDTGLSQPLTDDQLRAEPVEVVFSNSDTPLTASVFSKSDAGDLPEGAYSISFLNMGEALASVAGGPLPSGVGVSFEAPAGSTLASISYSAIGTTLLISETRQ